MHTNQQFNFLQGRIEEIGSAIFHNLSEAVLKLPTSIITTVKADDYGFVWFYVQKPTQHLKEFEQEFPVKMDFYKKGAGCFMQVTGQGFVVTDPEEKNAVVTFAEEAEMRAADKYALVKVKIQKAEYHQTRTADNTSWWQQAWTMINAWLGNNSYRIDNTYYPAS